MPNTLSIPLIMVRMAGLEPAHLSAEEPKSSESANSTTSAYFLPILLFYYMSVSIIFSIGSASVTTTFLSNQLLYTT